MRKIIKAGIGSYKLRFKAINGALTVYKLNNRKSRPARRERQDFPKASRDARYSHQKFLPFS